MTYFRFHLLFNLPILIVLGFLNHGHPWQGGELSSLGIVLLLVLAFTSPWDNWAVSRGIWDFPPDRVWRRVGYLPVEEYLFFLLQSVNVILSIRWFMLHDPGIRSGLETPLGWLQEGSVLGILLIWLAIGIRCKWRPRLQRHRYSWHLLFWFLPVILLQWALAPLLFGRLLPILGGATFGWGTYYVLADLVAVQSGIWYFDEKQITGWKLLYVLPWEEMAFFYLTSLLIAQSYLLLLPASLR